MSKSINTSSSISAFTVNGTNIQNDADINIKGNYNVDGTITWYNRTTVFLVWKRPAANEIMELNEIEPVTPRKGKYFQHNSISVTI